jgi:hypothetical protein
MNVSETHRNNGTGKRLSGAFPNQNGLNHRSASSQLIFKFVFEYVITNDQENQEEMKFSWTYRLLVHTDDKHKYNIEKYRSCANKEVMANDSVDHSL